MYKNNKGKFFISAFLLSLILIPQMSLASAVSLRSSTSKIEPNKTFSLSIYVNPTAVTSYTAGVTIKYPAYLVSVESFSFNSAWIPLSQAGLDLIDNTSGKLIKTAGYPSGFSTETLLGTAVIKSKKAGSVSITTDKESYVLDIDSNNTLTGFGSFSITSASVVVAPVITPPVTKTTTTPVVKKEVPKTVEVEKPIVAPEAPVVAPTDPKTKAKSLVLFFGIIISAVSAYLGFQ